MNALDRFYRWVTSHRWFAGALLLTASMYLLDTLVEPAFPLLYWAGVPDDLISVFAQWWWSARYGFSVIADAALVVICVGYLVRAPKAYRAEARDADVRPMFFLKRGLVLLFLGYYIFAMFVSQVGQLFYRPATQIGWEKLAALSAAGLFVSGIALLAVLAQRFQRFAERSDLLPNDREGAPST